MVRKRLTPANPSRLKSRAATNSGTLQRVSSIPPVAQIAGEASASAALQELTDDLSEACHTGRMLVDLPLDKITADHLARDRILVKDEDFDALCQSIRQYGQRTPIEVSPTVDPETFGLISGWRRLTAMSVIFEETQDERFSTIRTMVRRPENASSAYVSMVEENEIRVGLSHYERARIAGLATDRGVFKSEKEALQTLFKNVSRAKRSKIGSFLRIYRSLDDILNHPNVISERLGLKLTQMIDEGRCGEIRDAIAEARPRSGGDEIAILEGASKLKWTPQINTKHHGKEVAPGVWLDSSMQNTVISLRLSGSNVTESLRQDVVEAIKKASKRTR